MSNKLLITTSLEETWGDNEEIIFLGEWCRRYELKNLWKNRTHEIAQYHWDDRDKLRKDYLYLKGLHDKLLVALVPVMNAYHEIDRPVRYWQMILGPWLLTYVAVIWDRWECVRLLFKKHEVLDTITYKSIRTYEPPFDYNDFMIKINEDLWNHYLYLDIINKNYNNQCNVINKIHKSNLAYNTDQLPTSRIKKKLSKNIIIRKIDDLISKLAVNNSIVFFQSYFHAIDLIKLNLILKQIPCFYIKEFGWPVEFEMSSDSVEKHFERNNVSLDIMPKSSFETFLFSRIINDIPSIYVEHYSALRAKIKKLKFNPKIILTANAHWSNEMFKQWSAEQVFHGTKLVTMEHGGALPALFNTMQFEEDIADIRTTWAVPYHIKHKRMPPNKIKPWDPNSKKSYLAVVGVEMPAYSYRVHSEPISGQTLVCYEMVCKMYSLLAHKVKEKFLIKPYNNRGWNTKQRYIDILGKDKVFDEDNYYRFISDAKIIICTYPQTTFSEAMASGLPTILYYPEHLWETIPQVEQLIKTLRAAKIIFHDPQEVASHINLIWDQPYKWWNRTEVVNAREEFHQQALNLREDWLKEWASFINTEIVENNY